MIVLEINIINNYLKITILLYLYCLPLGTFSKKTSLQGKTSLETHSYIPSFMFLVL